MMAILNLFVGDDFSFGTSIGTMNFYRNTGAASNPVRLKACLSNKLTLARRAG
jgi:hypothetical protein